MLIISKQFNSFTYMHGGRKNKIPWNKTGYAVTSPRKLHIYIYVQKSTNATLPKCIMTQAYIYIYLIGKKLISFEWKWWLPYTPNQGRKSFHVRSIKCSFDEFISSLLPSLRHRSCTPFILFFFFINNSYNHRTYVYL